MCGIAGAMYSSTKYVHSEFSSILKNMGDVLEHRGPDDSGEWFDLSSGIGLAHRRLSIIDLSAAGHQPMHSHNNRYTIVFNGEIYNFGELRKKLSNKGVSLAGNSDTEVLLESIVLFGLEKALECSNGMFAFALWDREEKSLILARDRIGKKPLYYGWCNNVLLFGSELKALKAHPSFDNEIDRNALGQFIQYSWLNGPASIYKNIKKLEPGSYLKIAQSNNSKTIEPVQYWSASRSAENGQSNLFSGTFSEASEHLENLLLDSVNKRMIADVELGALLSGGIDSSLVVSMMQAQSVSKIKTFSIGFNEATHNEAVYAKKIAKYLGTDHTELYVTPDDCLNVIPMLPDIYDEPFGDASQIPTYLVSKLASENVKVVLSGDGGDELFAGYTRYFRCLRHWDKQKNVPTSLRPSVAEAMDLAAKICWQLFGKFSISGEIKEWQRIGSKLEKRARRIDSNDPTELFVKMMSRIRNVHEIVNRYSNSETILSNQHKWPKHSEDILNMMLIDTLCYLPDDILVKVDRASMAVSLEARCPFLDKQIAEFSWRLPQNMKAKNSEGKIILKDILSRYIPAELTERRKMGFGVPTGLWLRGPLMDWAENLLDPARLEQQGYLNKASVLNIWRQHKSGWRNHSDLLWSILMFQAWLEKNS